MGVFDFVSGWKRRLIDEPLDAKMANTLKVGLTIARQEVHVITGHLQASIGGSYDRSTKTIQLHADASYALIEETRPPQGAHAFLAPAANEMARLWGGNFELHYPNAAIGRDKLGLARNRQREQHIYHGLSGSQLKGVARRVQVHSRRWHRWAAEVPTDPATPIL